MEVRTTVTVTDKEIREMVTAKAREVAGKDQGSSTIEFTAKPITPGSQVEVSAQVHFQKQNAR